MEEDLRIARRCGSAGGIRGGINGLDRTAELSEFERSKLAVVLGGKGGGELSNSSQSSSSRSAKL